MFNEITFHLVSFEVVFCFITLILLIILSAFISGSETAFFSLNQTDLEEIRKNKERTQVLRLLKEPNILLATILIANNFINVAIIILFAYLSSIAISFPEESFFEFFFQVIVITFLLVLFGEINPKVYANYNSRKFSLLVAKPLVIIKKILFPFSYLLVAMTNFIDRSFIHRQKEVSIEEISKALDLTEEKSNAEESRILRSILEFGNTDAKEVMKSRVDVLAIEESTLFSEVLSKIISSGFSRIPVYREQFDNVIGVLYIKDLIPFLNETNNFCWIDLCRRPYFVPENKMINDLLKEFQIKKNHMAIVVDEYGGTSGIVTLEDVLEEIVGEINDEFDEDDNMYSKLDANNYIFEGKISLIDFLKIVKAEPDYFDHIKGDADSLAGLILEKEGKILKIGEICNIPPYKMLVESSDNRRIKRLKVTFNEK